MYLFDTPEQGMSLKIEDSSCSTRKLHRPPTTMTIHNGFTFIIFKMAQRSTFDTGLFIALLVLNVLAQHPFLEGYSISFLDRIQGSEVYLTSNITNSLKRDSCVIFLVLSM